MTPQEQDMLTNLVTRLRQAPPQQRDPDAEAMINDLVREKPDTPYVLAQTVLIQDYSLHQAQTRIAELERQLADQKPAQQGGFLSGLFGGGSKPAPAQPVAPQPQPSYSPPTYAPPPAAGPWGGSPAQQVFAQPGGQPSFLRSAATTAAGIAGGALLFEGIESLFGGHGGGFGGIGGFGGAGYGGFMPQPGLTETVVNNYYGDTPPDTQSADFDHGSAESHDGGFTDTGFDDNGDSGGGDGGDFGGGDGDSSTV